MAHPVVGLREVVKEYRRGNQRVRALDGVSFDVESGELVVVMGPSGAGKSTLLHLIGGIDVASAGTIALAGTELGNLGDEELTTFRRRHLGFVFQFFNLLPTLSAWENVAVPRLLDGIPLAQSRQRATELLERVGLGHRLDHRPSELSGGEMQRVAIARALVADPVLVLADEPTGNLDSRTGEEVLEVLRSLTASDDRTVLMVTHDAAAASKADRVISLVDGRVSCE